MGTPVLNLDKNEGLERNKGKRDTKMLPPKLLVIVILFENEQLSFLGIFDITSTSSGLVMIKQFYSVMKA